MPLEMSHRIVIQCEIAMLGISLQQSLALQKAGNTLCDSMGELREFVIRRRLDPAEPCA